MSADSGVAVGDTPLQQATVLLVEVGMSHDEVLLSWYRDLKHLGATVHVACPNRMRKRLQIHDADGWLDAEAHGGLWSRLALMRSIRSYVLQHKISHVVLNTASGTTMRDITRLLPSACTVVGILHDVSKLSGSSNQRVISRNVDAYAVLAPYLLDAVPAGFRKSIVVVPATATDARDAATTITEHDVSEMQASVADSQSTDNKLRVVIAGGINWHRRDYDALFTSENIERLGTQIEFVLAGGPDPEHVPKLRRMLDLAPSSMIHVHDGYIPHDVYAEIIRGADVVLPLTHPRSKDYHHYIATRISGAMSSAWAHAKPLMLEHGFERHASLSHAIFYDAAELPDLLRRFAEDRSLLTPYAVTPLFAMDVVRRTTITELFGALA